MTRIADRVYNFAAGPAMLPDEVMVTCQKELLNFRGCGSSLIEISHRGALFRQILAETKECFAQLVQLRKDREVLFMHGGARGQFSAVPMNLAGLKPGRKAGYIASGIFSTLAAEEARKYADVHILASGEDEGFSSLPAIDSLGSLEDYSYVHITGNNTLFGSQWFPAPSFADTVTVCDATSDYLSRTFDYSRFPLVYGSLQKNLGPAGLSLLVIDPKLAGHHDKKTPLILDFDHNLKADSLANTTNTFAIYMTLLVLKWVAERGGVAAMEELNRQKSGLIYDYLDSQSFYKPMVTTPEHRSLVNVTFRLSSADMEAAFVAEGEKRGLTALKGHARVGGIRASMYNAMPLAGAKALLAFMQDFAAEHS